MNVIVIDAISIINKYLNYHLKINDIKFVQ